MDISAFKAMQKKGWPVFASFEMFTGTSAPRLVSFAHVRSGEKVLDVACGTGVAGLAAARIGAHVTGIDLTPELLVRARENKAIAGVEMELLEADAEELPFPDATFDTVVSQFGHMFAPRPDVATKEMLRVLRPGGTLAFSTFPPELFAGALLDIVPRHMPRPPGAPPSPTEWGRPDVVVERLGNAVTDVRFDRDVIVIPALSVAHLRLFLERNIAPLMFAVQKLGETPEKLAGLRLEIDTLLANYFDPSRNALRQDYLLTRAIKRS